MQQLTTWVRRLQARRRLSKRPLGLPQTRVASTAGHWMRRGFGTDKLTLVSRLCWLGVLGYAAVLLWRIGQPLPTATPQSAPFAASATKSAPGAALTEADLGVIFQQQWFGALANKPVTPPVVAAPAAVTKLSFILRGVAPASDPARSVAVIEAQGRQASYMPGEAIADSAVRLLKVETTQVWLDNGGVTELLVLPGEPSSPEASTKSTASTKSAIVAVSKPAAPTATDASELAALRDEIAREPQKIFSYIRLSPVRKDNVLVGYRVSPGVNRLLFEHTGLKDKDIAVALNGLDLTDDQQAQQALRELPDLTSLTLTVVRDQIRYDILISP
ncbi:type II secretion system protein GspC [Plesiomonas shigelloides]|uniref:type II secretion system protein GspC n=1 Tax=Plesiomonas shigelloides TaxID=703 RepID=UPI002246D5D2|nr:type II secretion system protein GspC [Plesiomonas shigelloides]MCX2499005.1 type II secretion system protein GspC [Plesiomonas shigelloides]